MEAAEAKQLARRLFVIDEAYGCAESAFIALKHTYELPNPDDAGPAMALNGGIGYSGGMCGAITGTALAVGQLAASRIGDPGKAKTIARKLTAALVDDFEAEFGNTNCRDLTGADFRDQKQHDDFIDAGTWKTTCGSQVEFAVARLAELRSESNWESVVAELQQ